MSEPSTPVHLRSDELKIIDHYRSLKKRGHGELLLSIKDSNLVRLNITEKVDLSGPEHTRLKET